MGFNHGRFQVISPTWKFLRMTCKQLIDNWYVGNQKEKIPRFELLSTLHVAHLGTPGNHNSGKVKLIQMRCVMTTLEKYENKESCYLRNKGL